MGRGDERMNSDQEMEFSLSMKLVWNLVWIGMAAGKKVLCGITPRRDTEGGFEKLLATEISWWLIF